MARTPRSKEQRVTETPAEATPPRPAEASSPPDGRVAELRVSAHVMTLERGLFCVFPAPGSPMPDPTTGLPGVRVTPTPSRSQSPNGVSISTFRADGWLESTAALVKVTDDSAQILVSIYQSANNAAAGAPRLQVLRLSGEDQPQQVAPAAAPSAAPPAPSPAPGDDAHPEVVAHIQRAGDVAGDLGQQIGTPGSQTWIEGFGLAPRGPVLPSEIEYQGVLGRGWLSPWVEGGKFCGSRGMALPLLGLKIRLKGDAAEKFNCTYSATFVDGSRTGPIAMGDACEADSLAALESFRIEITPRDAAPRPRARSASPPPAARSAAPAKAPARAGRR
jgi:hypothetical protein